MPPILRIIVFVAVLVAVNQRAPGLAQAILVLVALYLLLTHEGTVKSTIGDTVDRFGGLYKTQVPGPR